MCTSVQSFHIAIVYQYMIIYFLFCHCVLVYTTTYQCTKCKCVQVYSFVNTKTSVPVYTKYML
jgi:hypothetical protein